MRKAAVILIILVILIISAAAAGGAIIININKVPQSMPGETMFRVSSGDTAYHIAGNLEDSGLIKSSRFFVFYSRFLGTTGSMKSGLYRITGHMTTINIHTKLISGSEELYPVTIPPGLTARNIGEILEKEGITGVEDFLEIVASENAEGCLFPDTYNFPKDYPAAKVVEYMKETFFTTLEAIYPEYENMDEVEVREKIIMASIIEREYRNADEAARIASVFYNRIAENMYLGSCATVVWVITEELGKKHPERLLYRDLEISSPYNTYRNKGLPPGPICNPGKTALNAAFNPENTDFLYFLLEDPEKGTHLFSKSLSEHNRSYELYIKVK